MSTVPGPDTPAPANNAQTLTLQSDPGLYARPTAGNNAAPGGSELGPGATAADAPAGVVPSNPIAGGIASAYTDSSYLMAQAGAPVSTGGTQAGPDMGHGATQILSGISGGGDTDNDGDTQ